MNQETKNKFAEILAAAQNQAQQKKIVSQPGKVKEEFNLAQTPELSTVTFDQIFAPVKILEIKKELQIIDYSPKSFAIIGETKAVKEKLKELGGKFNFRLTCGPGWIFPKKKAYTVRKALNLI